MSTEAEKDKLRMVIHPLQGDKASLSLSSFSNSIESLRKVAGKFHCNDLKVVSLSSNSPVSLTIAHIHDDAIANSGSLSMLFDGLDSFLKSQEIPVSWTRSTIDAVLDFLNPIGNSVGRVCLFSEGKEEITLDVEYKTVFKNKIEDDFFAFGTVDGMLDAVNIHGRKKALALYPSIGHDKVSCEFDDQFLEEVKKFIGCYVEISGEMKYRWRDKYPHFGTVSKIEVIEEESLPKFSDLLGIAPNATHGIPAEDFIARIRSEWK